MQWTLGTGQLRETIEQQNNRIFKVEIIKVEIFKDEIFKIEILKILKIFLRLRFCWTILVDNSGGHLFWTILVDNSGGHLFWTILVDIYLRHFNKHASTNIAAAI